MKQVTLSVQTQGSHQTDLGCNAYTCILWSPASEWLEWQHCLLTVFVTPAWLHLFARKINCTPFSLCLSQKYLDLNSALFAASKGYGHYILFSLSLSCLCLYASLVGMHFRLHIRRHQTIAWYMYIRNSSPIIKKNCSHAQWLSITHF